MSAGSANLVEVFSSVQGEGPHVGRSTLFVRFGGCDLRCRWCDSPHTWAPALRCRIERAPGSGRFRERDNPVAIEDVLSEIEALEPARHAFASLTGGEPLLQPDAVRALAETLRARGPRIHLETHGAAPEALARVVDVIDVVSMDWKLASDVWRASDDPKAPSPGFQAEHERFLEIARSAPECVVKLVVTPSTRDDEIDAALDAVARLHPGASVVLQPVTPCGGVREPVAPARVLALARRAGARVRDVRVIPQTHKLVGVP